MSRIAMVRHPAVVFGGLALAFVAAGGWLDRVQHRELLREAERKVESIARVEARAVLEWRRSLQRNAVGAAQAWSPLLGEGGPLDGERLQASVAAYRDHGVFTDVAVLGPRGEAWATAGSWTDGIPPRPIGWGRLPVIAAVQRIGSAEVLHVYAPAGSGCVAVFRTDIREGVEPLLAVWATPSRGSSRLVRRGGEVLLAPDQDPSVDGPVIEAQATIEASDWAIEAELSRTDLEQPGSMRRPMLALLTVALVAAAGLVVQARARRERLSFLERSWRVERRARLLRDEQARLVEAVDDPVLLLDVDRRVRFWNAAAVRVYGYPAEEAIGRTVAELLGVELLGDVAAYAGLGDGLPVRVALEHRGRGGTAVQVEATAVALRDADGGLTGYLAVCRDRTEQLRDEAARRAMEAQLAQADRMASMGLVAASVAHEMATPLTYVLSSLRYAREELAHPAPSLDDVRSALEEAEEGGERVRRILAEVRTFSRSSGHGDGPADVARVVESALRLAAAELRHRARVAVDVPPLHVGLGADRLGQVLLNLVMNAAQAIPPGAPDRNAVRVSARREGAEVLLEVSDSGGGIPPAVAARIFEPFYTTKPRGVGTGLGLSICRRLVEEGGGALSFETAPGAGTTFKVRLPAAASASPAPPRARLLLVSAEVRAARALARGLEADLDVHLEADPRRAAARLCGGEPFEVILCDAALAGMDGATLLDQVARARPALRERFVFVAGAAAPVIDHLRAAGHVVLERPLEASAVCRLVLGRLGAARQVA